MRSRPTLPQRSRWRRRAQTLLLPAPGRGIGSARGPGANRHGLTPVTSQNWRGARLFPPPPLWVPPNRHRAANRKAGSARADAEAGPGGDRARPGRGVGRTGLSCRAPGWSAVRRERERAEGCGRQPRPTAAGALLDPVRILVHCCRVGRGRSGRRRGGRAWAATAGGGPRSGGAAAGPGRTGLAVSAWHVRLGSPLSRSAPRGCAGCPRLEVCGSGRRTAPAGPEDAARPWAQRADCTERPRGARPGSLLGPGGRLAGRVGLFGFFFSPPLSPPLLRSLLPPGPFTGLLRDLAPPPLPPPRHRLL